MTNILPTWSRIFRRCYDMKCINFASYREIMIYCILFYSILSRLRQIYTESCLCWILWHLTNYHPVWYLSLTELWTNAAWLQFGPFQRVLAYQSWLMLALQRFWHFNWMQAQSTTCRPQDPMQGGFSIKRYTERMASQSVYSSTIIKAQLWFKMQGVWGCGAGKAINSTIGWYKEIEYQETLVRYIDKILSCRTAICFLV